MNIVSNRWLAVRLEFIGNCVIFFAALFAVLAKEIWGDDNAGVVGVSITYALNVRIPLLTMQIKLFRLRKS